LSFERAIGHTASTLQHRHRLVENFLKGHGRPSAALACAPADGKVLTGVASHREAARVYQEHAGVAPQIAPPRADPVIGSIGKEPEQFQKNVTGMPLSGTLMRQP
jgi:hypothetical protein